MTIYPIAIIGCHRSGTSLLAEMMRSMGLHIGSDLNNHAEDMVFLRANEEIFRICHATWDRPMAVSECLKDSKTADGIANYIADKIKPGNPVSPQWGWKDPRTTFTLPVWARIFPQMRVLGIVRHGVDVVNSLVVREIRRVASFENPVQSIRCQDPRRAMAVWGEYTQAAMQEVRHRDGMLIRFEDLLSGPSTWQAVKTWAGLSKKNGVRLDCGRAFAYRERQLDDDIKRAAMCEPLFKSLSYTI